jgi:hypothetical protein
MPRIPFRISLFLSSYAPLFALMAFQSRHSTVDFWLLIAACVVGLVGLGIVMTALSRSSDAVSIEIATIFPKDNEVVSYIATYLLPFLGVDLSDTDSAIVFWSFMLILCVVYINSSMIFVNPLLSILGYRTFDVVDLQGNRYAVLTRRIDLEPGMTTSTSSVDRYIKVDARWRRYPKS